ncbi:MAG: hypothetical protein EZS28_004078 [Streblomastix strix]|uniref:Uncharacterized protein n=1 Tax=Streblomastix strix TaxID=222440 RepID=A0A5J4X1R9_9EUKA|nr:MAG: hypothetical protein EZS28_004078 [Streblomastix strix]
MHEKGIIHRFRDIKGQKILLHSPPGSGLIYSRLQTLVAGTMPLMSREMLMSTEDGEVKADSKGIYFIS